VRQAADAVKFLTEKLLHQQRDTLQSPDDADVRQERDQFREDLVETCNDIISLIKLTAKSPFDLSLLDGMIQNKERKRKKETSEIKCETICKNHVLIVLIGANINDLNADTGDIDERILRTHKKIEDATRSFDEAAKVTEKE
jgi:hypothetical protein